MKYIIKVELKDEFYFFLGNKWGTTTQSKIGKIGLFTRNIASDKTIIMKKMTKNQGILFPPEESTHAKL